MVHCVIIIAALWGSNLGLLESRLRVIQGEYSTHWEVLFSYMMTCKMYSVLQIWTNCMLIMICFGCFEYFWVYWNYDDVLKYEYDMWF
jgi:hypothetical protein